MDNKKVIKEFLEKMAKQDNRCTASPYFYVIRTEVEVQADPDNCDIIRYYDPNDFECTYETKEECRKEMTDCGDYSEEEIEEVVDRLERYGVRKEWRHKGMFLTEEDAEDHLRKNYYHYSHNAHTYVDHAWRAPQLTAFFRALFEEYEVDRGNWGS